MIAVTATAVRFATVVGIKVATIITTIAIALTYYDIESEFY